MSTVQHNETEGETMIRDEAKAQRATEIANITKADYMGQAKNNGDAYRAAALAAYRVLIGMDKGDEWDAAKAAYLAN